MYCIDDEGVIIEGVDVVKKNNDWELVMVDDKFFYIGDFGNNVGKCRKLVIYKVSWDDLFSEVCLIFMYDNYELKKNELYVYDFDVEVMVVCYDKLVLFLKSWFIKILWVYYLNK